MSQLQNKYATYVRQENRKYWWQLWRPKYKYVEHAEIEVLDEKPASTGSVVKVTTSPQYDPTPRTGGRVTKAMPRSLKKLKEAQEYEVPTMPR